MVVKVVAERPNDDMRHSDILLAYIMTTFQKF